MTNSPTIRVARWAIGGAGQRTVVAIARSTRVVTQTAALDLACWASIDSSTYSTSVTAFPVKLGGLRYTLRIHRSLLSLLRLLLSLLHLLLHLLIYL
jgi:hypothetical protein